MSYKHSLFFTLIAFLAPTLAQAQSALRIQCLGPADGAKVYINGEFKGDCPADLFLAPGSIKLRVVKNVDAERIRVFEKDMFIADNAVKKVKVVLSAPQLSPEAVAERARKAAELKAAKLREKALKEQQTAAQTLAKAKQGDAKAMRSLADLYQQGKGLDKNAQQASNWLKQAEKIEQRATSEKLLAQARQGNIASMHKIAQRYRSGLGIERNSSKAQYWEKKAVSTRFEQAAKGAEEGDTKAMRELASLYASGKGVTKDPAKSQQWLQKAEKIDREALEAKEKWAQTYAKMQALDNLDFFEFTKGFSEMALNNHEPGAAGITSSSVSPMIISIGVFMDVSSSPFNLTKYIQLKSELAARPSVYHNPDSMVAKAYRRQK